MDRDSLSILTVLICNGMFLCRAGARMPVVTYTDGKKSLASSERIDFWGKGR